MVWTLALACGPIVLRDEACVQSALSGGQAAYEADLLIEKRARATTVDADPGTYAPQEFSVVHVPERKYGV